METMDKLKSIIATVVVIAILLFALGFSVSHLMDIFAQKIVDKQRQRNDPLEAGQITGLTPYADSGSLGTLRDRQVGIWTDTVEATIFVRGGDGVWVRGDSIWQKILAKGGAVRVSVKPREGPRTWTLGIPIDRRDSLKMVQRGWTITTSTTYHVDGRRSEGLWANKAIPWN